MYYYYVTYIYIVYFYVGLFTRLHLVQHLRFRRRVSEKQRTE